MTDPLDTIRIVASEENGRLCQEYPEQATYGGTLLLGKHYAYEQRGILMLGLNPGVNRNDSRFSVQKCPENFLLPGSPDHGFSYWRNAKALFGATPALAVAMQTATFSFCCPFRTPAWNAMPGSKRDALIRHSKPILTRVLRDCAPRLVIVAGLAGLEALRSIAAPALDIGKLVSDGGDPAGTYQWRAYQGTFQGEGTAVAQIPHLSRANARVRLANCGRWLSDLVTSVA